MIAHNLTPYVLYEARAQVRVLTGLGDAKEETSSSLPVGRPPVQYHDQKHRLENWLHMYCTVNAWDSSFQLCFRPQIKWVYAMLAAEGMQGSYVLFLDTWHKSTKNISIPRLGDDLKHCATCMEIAYLRLQAVQSHLSDRVSMLDERLKAHIVRNYAERQVLYNFAADPAWYVLSADGTNPVLLPFMLLDSDLKRKLPKEYLSFFVVVHRSRHFGLPQNVFHFLLGGSGKPSTCNDVSSIAMEVARILALPSRPENLLVQCDGGPSCWNNGLLAYCAHLVGLKHFRRVQTMRLLVGHGGEQQDGATAPARNRARSLPFLGGPYAFLQMLSAAYTTPPDVHVYCDLVQDNKQVPLIEGPLTRDIQGLCDRIQRVHGIKQSNLEQGSDAGIHVWQFEAHNDMVCLRVKRLSSDHDDLWSDWYPILQMSTIAPDALTSLPYLGYGHARNGLTHGGKRKFGTVHDVAHAVITNDSLLQMMEQADRDWWNTWARFTAGIDVPVVSTTSKPATLPKPRKDVDLEKPPVLVVGPKRKAAVEGSPEGDVTPAKTVAFIVNRRLVGERLEYCVSWKPDGVSENTWEPLDALIQLGVVDLIHDFDAVADERTMPGGIAAESGFQYRGSDALFQGLEAAEGRDVSLVTCSVCGLDFKPRGLAQHQAKMHKEIMKAK